MTLADVKEYLKANIECDHWYVGKIDAKQEYCIGVYPTEPPAPIIAIGGIDNTSYATKAVSILIHWGQNMTPAEAKAWEIFDLLFGRQPVIGGKQVINFEFRTSEPMGIGTDDNGIFEFVINFVIYYKKGM